MLGQWKKLFCVTGPRQIRSGLLGWSVSEPGKVLQVPLRWEHAYGGTCQWPLQLQEDQDPEIWTHHRQNPIGCGWVDKAWRKRSRVDEVSGPQIEVMDRPFGDNQAHAMNYPAVGVGPVGRWWSPRREKAGTYDQNWKDTRWPRLPQDFDFGYWNCAPEDQQIDYPQGGETLGLVGFTPDSDHVQYRLPTVRPFIRARLKVGVIIGRRDMNLDTLIVDMQAKTLSCVYRMTLAAKAQPDKLEICL